jgi:hypothetical protein
MTWQQVVDSQCLLVNIAPMSARRRPVTARSTAVRAAAVRRLQARGVTARQVLALMMATGLSDEACRQNLRRGTRPQNPLVAAAWDRCMQEAAWNRP